MSARILLFLLFASQLLGTTWYLQKGAAGTNSGTLANPWQTVAAVVNTSIQTGDTVLVQGGDYSTEEVSIYFPSKSGITFRINPAATQQAIFKAIQFYQGDSCTVDGYLNNKQMFKIVGLALVNGTTLESGIYVRETNTFTVRGCEITQAGVVPGDGRDHHAIGVNGTVSRGIIEYNDCHNIITDCVNINNSSAQPSAGVYDWFIIRNNFLHYMGDDGIQLSYGGVTVNNNIILQAGSPLFLGAHPDGVQLNPDKGAVRIYRNLISGFNQSLFIEFTTGADNIEIFENKIIGVWPDPIALNTSRALNYSSRAGFTGTFLFANNVCYNFRSFNALNGGLDPVNSTNRFRNNIFLDCKFVAADAAAAAMVDSSNLFYSTAALQYYDTAGAPASTPGDQRIGSSTVGDPAFVSKTAYDFRLTPGSAAASGGTSMASFFTTDFLGVTISTWPRGPYASPSHGGVANPSRSSAGW